jgi:HEAT repeat protein
VPLLDVVALALSAGSAVMLTVLVLRRLEVARRARRRAELEDGLKPIALALLDGGSSELPALGRREGEVLADLLGRYAQAVTGEARDRVARYFAWEGTVARELDTLTDNTGDEPAWRRATAAFRLGDIGTPAAEPALVHALSDPSQEVRIAAARSLGRLRVPESVPSLLASAADRRVPGPLVRWALLQIGPQALPGLRALLSAEEPRARAGAVQLIGLLGGPRDAAEVGARLRDTAAVVRAQAALALARIGSEETMEALLATLEDRIPEVREAAGTALGALRDRRAAAPLAEHAEHDTFEVARASARSLVAIDPSAAAARAAASGSPHLLEALDLAGIG